MKFWKRAASITIGDRHVEGLNIRFKVTKSLTGDPNCVDIQVMNLSDASRAAIAGKDVPVVLSAGYVGAMKLLFSGTAQTVDHVWHEPDWATHIRAGDGIASFEKSYSIVSFGPGTDVSKVFEAFANDLGISVKDAVQKLRSGDVKAAFDTFLQGYAGQGRTVRELDRVAKAAGLEWSIQDGALQLLEAGKTTEEDAVLLSPTTGLVGSLDHGKPLRPEEPSYLKGRSLLNGDIRPGRAVHVNAEGHRGGYYRAQKVEHVGELNGTHWYTEVWLTPSV